MMLVYLMVQVLLYTWEVYNAFISALHFLLSSPDQPAWGAQHVKYKNISQIFVNKGDNSR